MTRLQRTQEKLLQGKQWMLPLNMLCGVSTSPAARFCTCKLCLCKCIFFRLELPTKSTCGRRWGTNIWRRYFFHLRTKLSNRCSFSCQMICSCYFFSKSAFCLARIAVSEALVKSVKYFENLTPYMKCTRIVMNRHPEYGCCMPTSSRICTQSRWWFRGIAY